MKHKLLRLPSYVGLGGFRSHHFYMLVFGLTIMISATFGQTSLAKWDFASSGGATTKAAYAKDANISSTNLATSFGSGLTAFNFLGNGFTAINSTAVALSDALTGNQYVSFKIAPNSGSSVTIQSINIRPVSQNRARSFALFSSRNGFAAGNVIGTISGNQSFGAGIGTFTISSGHTNLTTETEFRIYIYGYNNVYESVGLGESSGDDLEIIGNTSTSNIAVTSVNIVPTSISVTAGNTSQLSATVSPSNATNQNVSWSSSNTSIATVNSSGLVTGVAAGTATVTVTTQDGNKTDVCTVTVNAASVAVTGVSISPTSVSIVAGNTSQLSATIAPSNATNQSLTWSSSNTSIATVNSSGLVTGVAAGTATITVTTQDGSKTATTAVTVTAPTGGPGAGYTLCSGENQNCVLTGTQDVAYGANSSFYYLLNQTGTIGCNNTTFGDPISGVVKSCYVKNSTGTVAVTGVSISPTSVSIVAGNTSQITATIAPSNATNQNVTWSSSNTSIATVNSSGVVTGVAAGSATITVTTQDGGKTATSAITVTATGGSANGDGTLTYEYWSGVSGNLVTDNNFNTAPTGTLSLSSIEAPSNRDDNFGARIRGYIIPSTSGSYTFYFASDDYGEFDLSTDNTPSNISKIAFVNGWTNSREWTKYPSQTSVAISLVAGQRYYFQILYKEGSGGDNAAVGWTGPGIASITIPTGVNINSYSTGGDTQAPTVPTALSSPSKTATSVSLSWTASTDNVGVAGYQVFTGSTLSGTTSGTTFTVSSLSASTAYSFTVKAFDAAGNVSAATSALNVTTNANADTQAPSVPTGLASSNVAQTSFTLGWTASTDNVEVAGYQVFTGATLSGTTPGTSFNLTGLTASTAYSMTVKAFDAAGNVSAASSVLSVTTSATGTAPTGYTENFDSGVISSGWHVNSGYSLSPSNQALKVKVGKNLWEEFSYDTYGAPINFSANPVISFRVRSDEYMELAVGIVDQNGTAYRDQYFNQLFKIVPSADFVDVTYDFTGNLGTIDPTKLVSVLFVVGPQVAVNANLFIDDFKIGSYAVKYPRLMKPITQTVAMNSGSTNLTLRALTTSTGVSVSATSSNTAIVPNPTVGSINSDGTATLTFTPNTNQSGHVVVSVIVHAPGKTDLSMPFDLYVNNNLVPTIDKIANISTGVVATSVPLTGITDGNPEALQTISVSATSSDQTVIKNGNISFNYTSPNSKAVLNFTPEAVASGSKTATITVTVSDNGGTAFGGVNSTTTSFVATVYNTYYKSPTANAMSDNIFSYIGKTYNDVLTGISDGNGGTNIQSVVATSNNTAAFANPTVSYTNGLSTATISYVALVKDTATITVVITNGGAPANSNGNTIKTIKFKVRGVDPPITGYSETFETYGVSTNPTPNVLGSDYYTNTVGGDTRVSWMTNIEGYPQKWYVEGQGTEQTFSINAANKQGTLVVNKPGSVPRTFAGTWYSPRRLMDLSANKYLSLSVSANQNNNLTFDIFDVNGNRYGLLPTKTVTGTAQTFTFVFDQAPSSPAFDFTKVAAVLLNTALFTDVNATFTLYNLKIGDKAENAPASLPEAISLDALVDRSILVNSSNYPVSLTNVYSLKDGIDQHRTITFSASSSNNAVVPNPTVSAVVNRNATVTLNPVANQTGSATITLTASASGVPNKTVQFAVNVVSKDATNATLIALDQTTSYQKITGIGTYLAPEVNVTDMGASVFRLDVGAEVEYGLEGAYNDNSDPNVLDLTKFKFTDNTIKEVTRAGELGMKKIIAAVWTPPLWMKGSYGYNPQQYNPRNVLLPEYYDEFAEYILGISLAFKDQFGYDLYAISLQNEPEFNASSNLTATCQYTKAQIIDVTKRAYARLQGSGVSTIIFGPETLPAQGNVLDWMQGYNNDATAKNAIGAFAIHSYSADAIAPGSANNTLLGTFYAECLRVTPVKEFWMTETSGYANNPTDFASLNTNMFSGFSNGLSLWTYFGLGPEQQYIYPLHKNYAKYVRPGALRYKTTSPDATIGALAFKNAGDVTATIVIVNSGTTAKQVKFSGLSGFPTVMSTYVVAPGIFSEFQGTANGSENYITLVPANSMTVLYGSTSSVLRKGEDEQSTVSLTDSKQVTVYPNPAKDRVSIGLFAEEESNATITLHNLVGQQVLSTTKTLNKGANLIELNLGQINSGIYTATVVKGSETTVKKLLIE